MPLARLNGRIVLGLAILGVSFVSVLLVAATVGGWVAYFYQLAVSCVWAAALLWLRVKDFWEED
ncbi:MAG: hypothetical protein QFX35_01175 [Candidatus Verstraetearchaeota archaeon]|nr:hypothetical protein [Candidatus Verstraetearchaeota archaeon]